MLITSPRHTKADLRLWAEYEEADRDFGQRPALAVKVERAIAEIKSFAAAGPCYAGVSWGKDSVVLASLIQQAAPNVPLAWLTYGQANNPECGMVRDSFMRLFPKALYHEVDVGESESMRDDFRPAAEATGATRYLSGVRADESGMRRMSMRRLGLSTDNVCRPLGWWTVADVFGYLAVAGLPVHPVYAMLGGGRWERQHLRVASIGGDRACNMGRREHEREYYGDVLNRLALRLRPDPAKFEQDLAAIAERVGADKNLLRSILKSATGSIQRVINNP